MEGREEGRSTSIFYENMGEGGGVFPFSRHGRVDRDGVWTLMYVCEHHHFMQCNAMQGNDQMSMVNGSITSYGYSHFTSIRLFREENCHGANKQTSK